MTVQHSNDSDGALRKALQAWELQEPLPPRFGEQVWQRIAREEAERPAGVWSQLTTRLGTALLRPALAVSYVTVLLAGGLLAGYWHAQADNARAEQALGTRYVR